MSKLKLLELFGGIGACSKALEKLGIDYEIVDYVEIDKYAVKSFNAMHNTNFEPQDICEWDKDIDVDLIMHGSPCQDFSLAGKQAGGDKESGTRSSLMYETIRIVEKLKPKYVIWENVKNLLSKKHRHNFDSYLDTMEQLGYKSYYQVLNAKDYGIPQNRERVFTISIRKDIEVSDDIKPSVRVNFEREKEQILKTDKEIYQCKCDSGWQDNKVGVKVSPTIRANNNNTFVLEDNVDFLFPPKQELKLKLKDMLEKEVDEKYYLSAKAINYVLDMNDVQVGTKWEGSTKNGSINKPIAMTIGCRSASYQRAGITNYVVDNEENEITVKEAKLRIKNATVTTPKNKTLLKEELCNNLIENGKVQEYDVIRHSYSNSRMKEWKNRNIEKHNEVPTLDTRCDCLGVAVNQPPLRIRKLTPKECWRLMGFDDSDFEKASEVNSNSQLYKQAGNSIVVNVLEMILKQLLIKDDIE